MTKTMFATTLMNWLELSKRYNWTPSLRGMREYHSSKSGLRVAVALYNSDARYTYNHPKKYRVAIITNVDRVEYVDCNSIREVKECVATYESMIEKMLIDYPEYYNPAQY